MLASRTSCLQKLEDTSGMMIILRLYFFIPKVKNRAISCLLNACFAILNVAASFWLIQNCAVISYNKCGIYQNNRNCVLV